MASATAPQAWILPAAAVTPASRVYGFSNTLDPIVPIQHITKTWQALGLDAFGAPVNVDATQTYNGTHELTTGRGTVTSAHTGPENAARCLRRVDLSAGVAVRLLQLI